MLSRARAIVLVVVAAVAGQGCAAIGIPPTGAGTAAGPEVHYTLDGIAFRTFGAPVDEVRRATFSTLRRMEIVLTNDQASEDGGRAMQAGAGDRMFYVELQRLTERTTRMRITAKQGWMWRDRATAGEIIVQTERTLNDMPAVSQRVR
jgi:hypothetical protein